MWDNGWERLFSARDWGRYPAISVVRFVARNFTPAPGQDNPRILEIGCGPGANLWFLAREGFDANGIDGSPSAIARLRKRFDQEGLRAAVRVCDAMHLPFDDASFDCVIDCECLYANSMHDAERILDEVKRTLKPGGKLLSITFMTGTYGDGRGDRMEGEPNTYLRLHEGGIRKDCGIVRFSSEEDVRQLYGTRFRIDNLEYEIRSEGGRTFEIREWIIACSKA